MGFCQAWALALSSGSGSGFSERINSLLSVQCFITRQLGSVLTIDYEVKHEEIVRSRTRPNNSRVLKEKEMYYTVSVVSLSSRFSKLGSFKASYSPRRQSRWRRRWRPSQAQKVQLDPGNKSRLHDISPQFIPMSLRNSKNWEVKQVLMDLIGDGDISPWHLSSRNWEVKQVIWSTWVGSKSNRLQVATAWQLANSA